jgi:hypothetical protein
MTFILEVEDPLSFSLSLSHFLSLSDSIFFSLGSLGVPGAIEDSERTAAFIRSHLSEIDEIYVSLDSHHVNSLSLSLDSFSFSVSLSLYLYLSLSLSLHLFVCFVFDLEIAYCSWCLLEKCCRRESSSIYFD